MALTQFAMVEELASLIKDNLPCKHLVLGIEEALVNFVQDDTSVDGVLELEPMNPYNRLLLHRLADIFGLSHNSVGEGDDRHLILERNPESSIPSILVSDLLWQHDEFPPKNFNVLRRKEVITGLGENPVTEPSLEERETAYYAARQRIFSVDEYETRSVKQRPRNDPMVARRMITHALGQRIRVRDHEVSSKDSGECRQQANSSEIQHPEERTGDLSNHREPSNFSSNQPNSFRKSRGCKLNGSELLESGNRKSLKKPIKTSSSAAERNTVTYQKDCLMKEHTGAAKRLFANALGICQTESNISRITGTRKTNG